MIPTPRGSILIIDDQPGIRESMANILELEGFAVRAFEDGPSGLAEAAQTPFDLAFLDVKMPVMNGVEVLRRLRALQPAASIYMMTAYAEDELVAQALAEGALGCIHKPFDMEQILEVVAKTFAQLS